MEITRCAAVLALLLALVPAGCARKEAPPPPAAPRPQILKDVPVILRSTLMDTTGASDAERRTFSSGISIDTIAAAYRAWLPRAGWSVYNDRSDLANGRIDLYSRKGRATLWIHIEKRGETASEYTLIANTEDSLGAAPGKAGSVR